MRPWQRRIIGVLVIANVAFLVTLLIFLTRFSGTTPSLGLPSPVPTDRVRTLFSPACQRRAVRMLSQVGLGGTTILADRTLRFDLVYQARQDERADDVAQQVWKAFDVVLELADGECGTFSHIEVVIEAQGPANLPRVFAAVDKADLQALHGGELSESAFIDRVQYRTDLVDDDGL